VGRRQESLNVSMVVEFICFAEVREMSVAEVI